jgi:hypothetical protein
VLHATQPQERQVVSELNTLTLNAGRLQPAERDRLFAALVRGRAVLTDMDLAGRLLLERGKALDLQLSAVDMRQTLDSAREDYGACAVAPDLAQFPT